MKLQSIDKVNNLGEKNIISLIFSFFLTAFIGIVMNSIYNLTDTLFISRGIGDIAMGGVSIVVPFVLFQGAISTMIGGGAATLVSIKLGENAREEAGSITYNAMFLFYSIAIVITVIGLIFSDGILSFLGAKDSVFNYAKDYFTIILIGNVFSTGFSSIIRAEGKNFYGMLIWVVPIALNIALDAVFILGLKWGVKGAAAATVISQFTSFVLCVIFFTKFTTQKFTHLKIQLNKLLAICKIGLPVLAQVSAFSIVTAIVNIYVSKIGGNNCIIAFGYMSKIMYYSIAPFMALSQAVSPIISYNYGQNNDSRVRQTINISIVFALLYALLILLVVELIPNYLIMIFTGDSTIIDIGANGLRIVAISLLFMAIPMVIGTKLQAMKKMPLAVTVNLMSSIFAIILIVLISNSKGIDGIWLSYSLAHVAATGIILLAFIVRIIVNKANLRESSN